MIPGKLMGQAGGGPPAMAPGVAGVPRVKVKDNGDAGRRGSSLELRMK